MKAFIADGMSRLSHTFLRSDFASLDPASWTLIDIERLSFRAASMREKVLYAALALLLLLRLHRHGLALVLSRRGCTACHGLFIAARLLAVEGPRLGGFEEVRCHFLAKACVATFALHAVRGTPYTVVCHATDLYDSPRSFDRLLRAARRVECVTAFGKGFAFGRLGADAIGRVTLRRNALLRDSSAFALPVPSRPPRPPEAPLRLVGIGRMAPQKDFAFALRVVAELARLRPGPVLYEIVGNGLLRPELEALATRLGIATNVAFLGEMAHDAALHRLAGADGFLLPCEERSLGDADGLPVVFQEALALGVPVFCRQAFGVSELVIDRVNGLAFEAGASPRDWAEALAGLAGRLDPALVAMTGGSDAARPAPCDAGQPALARAV